MKRKTSDAQDIKTFSSRTSFLNDTESDVAQYSNANDFTYLIKYKHKKAVNKYIGVPDSFLIYTIAGIDFSGAFTRGKDQPSVVRFFSAFTNYDSTYSLHRIWFPEGTKFARCPSSHEEINLISYNTTTSKFYLGKREINIGRYINRRLGHLNLPLRNILGLPMRAWRFIRWVFLRPIQNGVSVGTKYLHQFLTGETYVATYSEKQYSLYQKQETSFEVLSLKDSSPGKVKIFDYEVSLQPLVSFSVVNLTVLTVLYATNSMKGYPTFILENPAITGMYAVSVFAFLTFAVGPFLKYISVKLLKASFRNQHPKEKFYIFESKERKNRRPTS